MMPFSFPEPSLRATLSSTATTVRRRDVWRGISRTCDSIHVLAVVVHRRAHVHLGEAGHLGRGFEHDVELLVVLHEVGRTAPFRNLKDVAVEHEGWREAVVVLEEPVVGSLRSELELIVLLMMLQPYHIAALGNSEVVDTVGHERLSVDRGGELLHEYSAGIGGGILRHAIDVGTLGIVGRVAVVCSVHLGYMHVEIVIALLREYHIGNLHPGHLVGIESHVVDGLRGEGLSVLLYLHNKGVDNVDAIVGDLQIQGCLLVLPHHVVVCHPVDANVVGGHVLSASVGADAEVVVHHLRFQHPPLSIQSVPVHARCAAMIVFGAEDFSVVDFAGVGIGGVADVDVLVGLDRIGSLQGDVVPSGLVVGHRLHDAARPALQVGLDENGHESPHLGVVGVADLIDGVAHVFCQSLFRNLDGGTQLVAGALLALWTQGGANLVAIAIAKSDCLVLSASNRPS